MTESKMSTIRIVKLAVCSLLLAAFVLFSIAAIRTFSLDVNAGLQLARWEKTDNISLVIQQHDREQLLARFKEAVRIPTVSQESGSNASALRQFDAFLRKVVFMSIKPSREVLVLEIKDHERSHIVSSVFIRHLSHSVSPFIYQTIIYAY
uniref:Peptidase M20 domain containing 1 n=1 Tax=Nothobranchius kadleci TaxID=1051664 RepID=A0A1A8CID1_NOTKA